MMIRALWSAATGMRAQQFNIDSIAHDLTNVNTNGYKKRHLNFVDLFYQSLRASGLGGSSGNTNLPVGIQVGHGVKVSGTTPIMTTGGALETGIWSDMMIDDRNNQARNFFAVDIGNGEVRYTRDGSFRVDSAGNLLTPSGYLIEPAINVPTDALDLQVTEDGRVMYRQPGAATLTEAGQIQLYTFVNPAGLSPVGDNLWQETLASGAATAGTPAADGFGVIRGGWLETSNVDAITEMVNMIAAQRSYEFNSRSIQTSDEMLQTVNNLKR